MIIRINLRFQCLIYSQWSNGALGRALLLLAKLEIVCRQENVNTDKEFQGVPVLVVMERVVFVSGWNY